MSPAADAKAAEKAEKEHQRLVREMCEQISSEIEIKKVQLRTLQSMASRTDEVMTAEFLLTLYMVMPSAKHVSEFVNKHGWPVPGAKGPRALCPADVLALIRGERCSIAPPVDALLVKMAREKFSERRGYLLH